MPRFAGFNERFVDHLLRVLIFVVCVVNLLTSEMALSTRARIKDEESQRSRQSEKQKRKPNILLLLSDDQDSILGGTDYMPKLKYWIANQGATLKNAFVHTPACCPSRSSIFSGRYLHNGGALNNSVFGNCYGTEWRMGAEQQTFAVGAKFSGYKTYFAGKYLNQYGVRTDKHNHSFCTPAHEQGCFRVPPGWDGWLGLVGNSQYYHYDVIESNDGGQTSERIRHYWNYENDYLPDVVANRTLQFMKDWEQENAKSKPEEQKPFLMVASWPSPHGPFTPAPQYQTSLENLTAFRTPNWNASRSSMMQKHWFLRQIGPIDEGTETWIDDVYRNRLRTLLSLDDHITHFMKQLKKMKQLDNTYVIYTSDNGFQLGQHRLRGDKRQLYEHDIRVPLYIRGPGIKPGTSLDEAVLNIDLAPFIHEIVSDSQRPLDHHDGASFLGLFADDKLQDGPIRKQEWRNDFLISYHGEGNPECGFSPCNKGKPNRYEDWHSGDATNNSYHCVRSMAPSEIYCAFDDDEDFVEYYDLETDPWQLHNTAPTLSPEIRSAFEKRLLQLRRCRGSSCRQELSAAAERVIPAERGSINRNSY